MSPFNRSSDDIRLDVDIVVGGESEPNLAILITIHLSSTSQPNTVIAIFGKKAMNNTVKVQGWFWVAAVILLLWNLTGMLNFMQHLNTPDEVLDNVSEAEKKLLGVYPWWAMGGFAVAVFGGTIGAVLLLMRRSLAKPFFMASLIGIVVQMIYTLPIGIEMGANGYWVGIMSVLLLGLVIFSIWLAQFANIRGWMKS